MEKEPNFIKSELERLRSDHKTISQYEVQMEGLKMIDRRLEGLGKLIRAMGRPYREEGEEEAEPYERSAAMRMLSGSRRSDKYV